MKLNWESIQGTWMSLILLIKGILLEIFVNIICLMVWKNLYVWKWRHYYEYGEYIFYEKWEWCVIFKNDVKWESREIC